MARGGGNRSRLLLVLLLVSSLFLITLDLRGVNLAGSIRSGVTTVFSPIEGFLLQDIFANRELSHLMCVTLDNLNPGSLN